MAMRAAKPRSTTPRILSIQIVAVPRVRAFRTEEAQIDRPAQRRMSKAAETRVTNAAMPAAAAMPHANDPLAAPMATATPCLTPRASTLRSANLLAAVEVQLSHP